jgi:hypothetical protein
VVGLPLFETGVLLERCGVALFDDAPRRREDDRRSAGRAAPRQGAGDARTA